MTEALQPGANSSQPPRGVSPSRAGVSLLEVLVACGILVVGLASIAAMLPAAGSRFAQAALADRAGLMTANAYSEVIDRGLLSTALFSSGTKACVFGKQLQQVPAISGTNPVLPIKPADVTAVAVAATLNARIDAEAGFLLQDDLVYRPPTNADTPLNSFVSGTSRIRAYNEGMCWGAMISSTTAAVMGGPATLSIAVFKKEGGPPRALTLSGPAGSTMLRYTTGTANGLIDERTRKQYLPGCAYVLALTRPPQWTRVTSSWTNPGRINSSTGIENAAERASFVILELNPFSTGATMSFVAFEHLVRVDQYPVTLD